LLVVSWHGTIERSEKYGTTFPQKGKENTTLWHELAGSSKEGVKWRLHRAPRACGEDEGGPLEVGLQEQASNHLKLLWSKAMVVSV